MFFSVRQVNPNSLLLRGMLAFVAGAAIVFIPDVSMIVVMRALGLLLLIDGIAGMLIAYYQQKNRDQPVYYLLPRGSVSLFLAFILLVFPTLLVNVFVFVVGLILFIAGFSQLFALITGSRLMGFSWVSIILALVALVCGVVLLAKPFESAQTILVIFGAAIAFYGIGEIVRSFKVRKYQQSQPKQQPDIIDAEYEEVE
jgi:membrane protein HdeD